MEARQKWSRKDTLCVVLWYLAACVGVVAFARMQYARDIQNIHRTYEEVLRRMIIQLDRWESIEWEAPICEERWAYALPIDFNDVNEADAIFDSNTAILQQIQIDSESRTLADIPKGAAIRI